MFGCSENRKLSRGQYRVILTIAYAMIELPNFPAVIVWLFLLSSTLLSLSPSDGPLLCLDWLHIIVILVLG